MRSDVIGFHHFASPTVHVTRFCELDVVGENAERRCFQFPIFISPIALKSGIAVTKKLMGYFNKRTKVTMTKLR